MRKSLVFGAVLLRSAVAAAGSLPVMDSVPRWDAGTGFEIYHEHYGSSKLMQGSDKISNPLGLKERVDETWFEGTYYPKKEYGLFFKLPYIDHVEDRDVGGVKKRESGSGFGDLELGVPLKHFWNMPTSTADITFAPMLRLPTGGTNRDKPIGDGSLDPGFALNGKWEDFHDMWMTGVEYWHNSKGSRGINQGDTVNAHLMYGRHFYLMPEEQFGLFLIPNIEAMWEGPGQDLDGKTGGLLVHGGPAVKIYKGNYLMFLGADFPIYERVSGTQLSQGNHYHVSIGTAF
jgi:hypothetical protein